MVRSGNLKITDLEWRHPLCDAFIEGANSIGIPTNTDYNGANQEGVSYVQRTTYKRRRVSSAKAFLNPAKSRKNLTVYTNAHVTRILFEARRAIGVELKRGNSSGQTQRISAKKEVILSGGAINSPQVLQLSGIGPANLLNDLEIPLVHDLPGV